MLFQPCAYIYFHAISTVDVCLFSSTITNKRYRQTGYGLEKYRS